MIHNGGEGERNDLATGEIASSKEHVGTPAPGFVHHSRWGGRFTTTNGEIATLQTFWRAAILGESRFPAPWISFFVMKGVSASMGASMIHTLTYRIGKVCTESTVRFKAGENFRLTQTRKQQVATNAGKSDDRREQALEERD